MRVFDLGTCIGASSIQVGSQTVRTIGDIDLAALDLFNTWVYFRLSCAPSRKPAPR